MYTNETTHFGIPLPLGSDLTTPMDYNTAAEAVDAALFEAQGDAATANENAAAAVETANATSEALGTLSTTVGGHTSQIAALAARMTGAENDITDVRSDLEDMVTAYNEPTATSTHAYSAGDYFIYNDVLYKATDAIAIGATIVPNTNCEATNISIEIAAVKSDLSGKADGIVHVKTVTGSSDKTYAQLLEELRPEVYAAYNAGKFSRLMVTSGGSIDYFYNFVENAAGSLIYAVSTIVGGGLILDRVKFTQNNTNMFDEFTVLTTPAASYNDLSSNTTSGVIIRLDTIG